MNDQEANMNDMAESSETTPPRAVTAGVLFCAFCRKPFVPNSAERRYCQECDGSGGSRR